MHLTKDRVLELLEYKENAFFWKVNTRASIGIGDRAGAQHHSGYRYLCIDGVKYAEHRVIFFLHHGKMPKLVDHVNGIRNDNRIENLREATQLQNNQNAKKRKDNTSGIKGVSWHKQHKKWYVSMNVNGKSKFFGLYEDLELAELVSVEARSKYYREFARHE